MNLGQVSIPVVIVFLFLTPLMLLAAWFAAFGVHKTVQGQNGGSSLVLAYAMLILASVDNLVYIPIHYGADTATSFFILGGIELVAVVLLFLYFQGMGAKVMALFASVMLVLSFGLELTDALRYTSEVGLDLYVIYNLVKKVMNELFAVISILFVAGLEANLIEYLFVEIDQVHFIHSQYHMFDTQQRNQISVAAGLRNYTGTGIYQDNSQVGSRTAGYHVTGILFVSRSIGDDKLTVVRTEITVSHVDRNTLFTFGLQAVKQ